MGTAVLTAATVAVVPAATATAAPRTLAAQGTPFSAANFTAVGTGSEISVNALQVGATKVANIDQAFSANTAAGGNLVLGSAYTSPITGALVQTDQTGKGKNAYGRGSGIEVGLGLSPAQANQIQLGIAEAAAPPTTGLITKTAIPLNLSPLLVTGLLTGKAAAAYSSSFCPVGQPLAYGEGDASAPTAAVTGTPPLVSGTGPTGTQAAQTRTRTDLVPNADGTFGIANTVQETIAPLTVNLGSTASLAVTVQGTSASDPLSITTFNDGEGHSGSTSSNSDPVVKIDLITTVGGVSTTVTLANVKASLLAGIINPLLAAPNGTIYQVLHGLGVNLSITVGSPPPTNSSNINYDLLAINASLPAAGLTIADVRVGHVESAVTLASAIDCTIPVAKSSSMQTVTAPGNFTWSISIPSSAAALADSACDLTNIKATDVIKVNSGSPSFTVGTPSNGGVFAANGTGGGGTITWSNLGTYHPGDPPIVLSVPVSVPSGSGAGVLQDTANVTASLGNCNGGATGLTDTETNVNLGGAVTFIGPQVGTGGAGLATTGTGPLLPWLAAGLVLMAFATRRLVRRVRSDG